MDSFPKGTSDVSKSVSYANESIFENEVDNWKMMRMMKIRKISKMMKMMEMMKTLKMMDMITLHKLRRLFNILDNYQHNRN